MPMGGQPEAQAVYTREDGVRCIQLLYLRQVETALAIAETYGLEDDPWISRLYECRALVQETLGQEPHPGRRRDDVRQPRGLASPAPLTLVPPPS